MVRCVEAGKVSIGGNKPLALIAGPCVIEDRITVLAIARILVQTTKRLKVPFIFKASYDKANRTSGGSFRGLGITQGLEILSEVKRKFGVPVLTDVHSVNEVDAAAEVADILQIPAFLCRQTDLLCKVARSGRVVNIKKGQFLAPWDMKAAVEKIKSAGNNQILLTERGVSFGYNNLVTDFRSLAIMQKLGYPVVFDASHSVQQPGGLGNASGGMGEFIPLMARCGVAAGANAIFMEVHTNPKKALSDGPNMLPLSQLPKLLKQLLAIRRALH